MLTNTFCHIPGIGPQTEARLWASGILCWKDMLRAKELPLPRPRREIARKAVDVSLEHYESGNVAYFASILPLSQHWRMLPDYIDKVGYLDIETAGTGSDHCAITTIALYNGHTVKTYVRGQNLEEFPQDLPDYSLLVTYNGSQFDLPMLARTFDLSFSQAHIDLRFALREVGITGGLKKCETSLGIDRGDLAGVNGYAAVLLWQDYIRKRRPGSLETLLAYNVADVLGLELLSVKAYNLMLEQMKSAPVKPLPMPALANNPYCADPRALKRLPKRLFQSQI